MCPEIMGIKRGIVTLITFVWFFSTVRFQMCPQIACLKRCKVTLIAFVWLFSTVLLLLLLSIYFLNWSSHFQKKDQFKMSNIIELKNRTDRNYWWNKQVRYLILQLNTTWDRVFVTGGIFKLAQDGIRFRDKVTNVVTGEDNYFSRNY